MTDTVSVGECSSVDWHTDHQLARVDVLSPVELDRGVDRVCAGFLRVQIGLMTSDLVP